MKEIWKRTIIIVNPIRGEISNPKKGGDMYVKQIIDKFISMGFNVIILSSSCSTSKNKQISCYTFPAIKGVGILFLDLNMPYLFKLIRVLKKAKSKSQLVLNGPFGAISTYIVSRVTNTKMVYIAHNVEAERYLERSVFEHESKLSWLLSRIVPVFESFAVKANVIISISSADKNRFVMRYNIPPDKILVCFPRIRPHYKSINKNTKGNIIKLVFHGSYRYLPNKEAIELIREYISKNVSCKNVKSVVFGSGAPTIKDKKDNFESLGFVDDLYGFLSSCDIAIVPLKKGAGVKIKMLDYMSVGLPIVTTKKGAEGLELVKGKHAIIVDDVNEEFVKAIRYLIENPKIRKKLGHNARKLAEKKYN